MFKKKSPQITQILTSKYIFVIIRVICGRKKSSYVLMSLWVLSEYCRDVGVEFHHFASYGMDERDDLSM